MEKVQTTNTKDKISTSKGPTNSIPVSFSPNLCEGELHRHLSKPVVFNMKQSPKESGDSEKSSILDKPNIINRLSQMITHEPTLPPDTWLYGGTLGARSANLIFKSSALANANELSIEEKPAYKLHITYKVLQAETKLLSKLLDCHGVSEVTSISSDFNLLWTGSHPKPGVLRSLQSYQRVNHFPRSYELTRKDRLYKNIERMQHFRGYKHFDFIPQTFLMPMEYNELCAIHNRTKGPWIIKPVASSRGRGIFIVEQPSQVPLEEPIIVAKYISNPLLISGHKCDLRLYVAVTSFDPLLIYIYEEGLVRFATVKYDSSHKQLWNPCMHLCNYSINKYHSDYVKSDDPSAENVGHKWTLSALLRHLKAEGKDTALLMANIEDLVIKAILSSAHSIVLACKMFVPNLNNCFELYGFDILIDADLKPWLLEVNLSPSLGCDSPLDVRLKSAMLADLLTLAGIPAVDPVLRPSLTNLASYSKTNNQIKMKLGNCRRVHSADGLSNTLPKKATSNSTNRIITNNVILSAEEIRVVKMARQQFEYRGGFVRIFPAIDSWAKYAQYLDPVTGIPISGNRTPSITNFANGHNFNLLVYTQLFPEIPILTKSERIYSKINSLDRKTAAHLKPIINQNTANIVKVHERNSHNIVEKLSEARQNRYERMLSQGHRCSELLPPKRHQIKDIHTNELRKQVIELLKSGKKLTQCETRKTFSSYLGHILKKILIEQENNDQLEIVYKFLQKATNYLRTPFNVKSPNNEKLDRKGRAALIAKQLNDFLYLYNRETELFVEKGEKPEQVPFKLYAEFLESAKENDLEEILVFQTTKMVPANDLKICGFQGILKCLPNVTKNCTTSLNKTTKLVNGKSKNVKVSLMS